VSTASSVPHHRAGLACGEAHGPDGSDLRLRGLPSIAALAASPADQPWERRVGAHHPDRTFFSGYKDRGDVLSFGLILTLSST
jgi:hypothetical protein